MAYNEEDWLQLSGIQHFCFCRRQWALIHIEQVWHENLLTAEGRVIHERVHDPEADESRGNLRVVRGMNIHSAELGFSGQCDVVEFHKDEGGVPLRGHRGLWLPVPVEYKRGTIKTTDADRLQLCAQALCLEEMLVCEIPRGYLFYHEIRRREEVEFTQELRGTVREMAAEMHRCFASGRTPKVRKTAACRSCSLANDCLPKIENAKAAAYIRRYLEE